MDYPSVICNYCRYTDYGILPVGTAYYNLCEGVCVRVSAVRKLSIRTMTHRKMKIK